MVRQEDEVRVKKKGRKESAGEHDPASVVKHARVYPFYLAKGTDKGLAHTSLA